MAGNLGTERSQRGDKRRGERESADKGGGGGSRNLARVKEGIWIRDLEGGRGGAGSREEECCGGTTNGIA